MPLGSCFRMLFFFIISKMSNLAWSDGFQIPVCLVSTFFQVLSIPTIFYTPKNELKVQYCPHQNIFLTLCKTVTILNCVCILSSCTGGFTQALQTTFLKSLIVIIRHPICYLSILVPLLNVDMFE